jgi:hypothetical protein
MAEPGGLTFLFDENMPQRLATAMRTHMGERTTHVYDEFGRDGVLDPEVHPLMESARLGALRRLCGGSLRRCRARRTGRFCGATPSG